MEETRAQEAAELAKHLSRVKDWNTDLFDDYLKLKGIDTTDIIKVKQYSHIYISVVFDYLRDHIEEAYNAN